MFTIDLDNYKCKIKITSATDNEEIGSITSLQISRREYGDTAWTLIKTVSITEKASFNFTHYDIYTRSRRTYEYKFTTFTSSSEVASVTHQIECNFDEIYVTDFTTEYFLCLELDFDYDGHNSIVVQEPINSRTPVVVKTGLSDYVTGYIEGLPLPLDANGNPTSVGVHKFKQAYMTFLKNGKQKFVKTYEGDTWLVYIHEPPKWNKAEVEGAETIRFSWTEIGDAPLADES